MILACRSAAVHRREKKEERVESVTSLRQLGTQRHPCQNTSRSTGAGGFAWHVKALDHRYLWCSIDRLGTEEAPETRVCRLSRNLQLALQLGDPALH
jgi:hypothetical protein